MKNFKNKNLYPSGPPRIAPTSRAPRRPPLPPLASYATGTTPYWHTRLGSSNSYVTNFWAILDPPLVIRRHQPRTPPPR